jgi:hypothetical protein
VFHRQRLLVQAQPVADPIQLCSPAENGRGGVGIDAVGPRFCAQTI